MFSEEEFQAALARPRLSKPVPDRLDANRSVPIRAIPEHELQQTTAQWFVDFQAKLDDYERRGLEVA